MHVVAAACAVKYLVAKDADRTESGSAALILVEVKAGCPCDKAVGMTGYIGRSRTVGSDHVVAAFGAANDE
jgi:hypothetical protein